MSPVQVDGIIIGHSCQKDGAVFFFGNRHGDLHKIKKAFPSLQFARLKQVHGDVCVESTRPNIDADPAAKIWPRADAHWTHQKNLALVIFTADCTPLLATDGSRVLAVHSGWRGTLANIIGKSLHALNAPRFICTGPHIQQSSFEVDDELGRKFQAYGAEFVIPSPTGRVGKSHVDLALLARLQAVEPGGGQGVALDWSTVDTLVSEDYASYRRDGANAGRNISFVALLKDPVA